MSRTINQITETEKIKYIVEIEDGNGAAHIPMRIGQEKGALIGFSGAGAPVPVPAGTDGNVLVTDTSTESGLRWSVAQTTTAIELPNNSGIFIPAGSICVYVFATNTVALAEINNSGLFYIALQDIPNGQNGLFSKNGEIVSVLCKSDTYHAGDFIGVSDVAGVGEIGEGVGIVVNDVVLTETGFVKVMISNNSIISHTEFYVDRTNGADTNDGLTSLTPFATMQKAVDACPVTQNFCTIHLSGSDNSHKIGNINIYGKQILVKTNSFYCSGNINIYLGGILEVDAISNTGSVFQCTGNMEVLYNSIFCFNRYSNYLFQTTRFQGDGTLIYVGFHSCAYFANCDISPTSASGIGIRAGYGSMIFGSEVTGNNAVANTRHVFCSASTMGFRSLTTAAGTNISTELGGRVWIGAQ